MVALKDPDRAERMRRLRNHGVTKDPAMLVDPLLSLDEDGAPNPWSYEQHELGFNYRMNELEAAQGLSQLARLGRFVRVSTLDEPHAIAPDAHIFTRSKVPWVVLPEGVRAYDIYYDMAREWPAESLARRRAILGDG